MQIATWNVNSVRTRRDRLLAWLERSGPDVLCLQELKVPDADFPYEAVKALGYHAAVNGQRAYNGVAILSRSEPKDVALGMHDGEDDPQARLIAATINGVRVISAYFPNGQIVGSEKWDFKLKWMGRLRRHLDARYDPKKALVLTGDFNVAPDDRDVANPAAWTESVLCHPDARQALENIRAWGFLDLFRHHHPEGGLYSWWDYRSLAYDKDDGLRIDHIFVTEPMLGRSAGAIIDRDEREGDKPSDHAPVIGAFDVAPESVVKPRAGARRGGAPSGGGSDGVGGGRIKRADGRKKLVIVDGHSVAYRAYYGLPLYDQRGKVSFSTAQGEFTNAVYGFTNMLIKVWNEEAPDYLAVAFDLGRTFRDDMFAEYKGTRDKMPDELAGQIDWIMKVVEAFGVPALTAEGYEADDILGTVSKRAASEGMDVLIVTGDSDAFQLIDEHIRVMAPGRLWSDTSVWTVEAVGKRYGGLRPDQLIDFKALVGDTSDNIPGVRGIGDKTAQALLEAYGSVEGIYEHIGEVQPNRAKNALEAGADMAALSKDLVTIRTDVPLDVEWTRCTVDTYDRAQVEALFERLEFRSIRNRLPAGGTMGAAAGEDSGAVTGDGADKASRDGKAPTTGTSRSGARRTSRMDMFGDGEAGPAKPAHPTVSKTTVVHDQAGLERMLAALKKARAVAFDTESTSTDPLAAKLVGISLAVEEGKGYYIPVGHLELDGTLAAGQLPLKTVLDGLGPIMADPSKPKVGHNAKYDMAILHEAALDVQGVSYDTMLAEFLIEPSTRLGLKSLARQRLSVEMTEISALIGTGKKQITMAEVPIDEAAAYAVADADVTLRLMHAQAGELKARGVQKLFDEVEMPLLPALLDMELAGVLVDTKLLGAMSERLGKRMHELESEAYDLAGMPFNLSSPSQLADLLFDRLGLKAPGSRTTSTGKASVAADVLDSMRGAHPIVDLVLEHRQLAKLKGTYIDALPRLVNPKTGRVHTSFNQTGAVSGRVASQDPNLQNIPVRTELGREVRKAFIVDRGCKLIAADYSQVELRIAAHITKDPALREAFLAGEDIHRATAAKVLGLRPDEVTADQRSFAKRVNFGLLYGMGVSALAQQAGIPMKEAQAFVDAYFTRFANMRAYLEDTKRLAKEQGYVETLLGRRRYFPILAHETRDARTNIMQRAAEREAINHPMQGSAADIMKMAMINLHRALREAGLETRMLLQVHDELLLEAPEREVDRAVKLVREVMEGAYPLDPPLKVDVGVGRNWDEVK